VVNEQERPQIQIIDALTGNQIIRDMNNEELSAYIEADFEIQAQQAEAEVKATARESALAKLAALGLTAEEVAAL
jgi:DNA-binding NarL/FixJ family response regulator